MPVVSIRPELGVLVRHVDRRDDRQRRQVMRREDSRDDDNGVDEEERREPAAEVAHGRRVPSPLFFEARRYRHVRERAAIAERIAVDQILRERRVDTEVRPEHLRIERRQLSDGAGGWADRSSYVLPLRKTTPPRGSPPPHPTPD